METLSAELFVCGLCYKSFTAVHSYYSHLKSHGIQIDGRFHLCEAENQSFAEKQAETGFCCHNCYCNFPTVCLMHDHLLSCSGSGSFIFDDARKVAYPLCSFVDFEAKKDLDLFAIMNRLIEKVVKDATGKHLAACSSLIKYLSASEVAETNALMTSEQDTQTNLCHKTLQLDEKEHTFPVAADSQDNIQNKWQNESNDEMTIPLPIDIVIKTEKPDPHFMNNQSDSECSSSSLSRSWQGLAGESSSNELLNQGKCDSFLGMVGKLKKSRKGRRHQKGKSKSMSLLDAFPEVAKSIAKSRLQREKDKEKSILMFEANEILPKLKTYKPFEISKLNLDINKLIDDLKQKRPVLGRPRKPLETCPICGQKKKKSQMKNHLTSHSAEKHFTCEICNRTYKYLHAYQVHKRSHTDGKSFVCEQCGKGFIALAELKRHAMFHHSEERPFKCEECGAGFITLYKLKRHSSLHTGIKPVQCDTCGARFTTQNSLNQHMASVHRGERVVCNVCTKKFTTQSKLNRHLLEHAGIRPFKCKVCAADYVGKRELRTHMKTYHDMVMDESCLPDLKPVYDTIQNSSGVSLFQDPGSDGPEAVISCEANPSS
ncbi:zinc finger protein 426-like [Dreissena polymorpha]|uniref:C2H2-type domain-containing protein n=1 Tax=Dreissena polymorpha TaxID=45954 RepID=A0A9D4C504_DREPO|nr:zinc finger protein 426-like [Dreissena polymorpha]XP_052248583.1 zinc finger protein 426-like [Dreissena polymorpha]KAH3717325.1 hypothetical protein DPMN_060108 [Dreissena polymorpha]